MNRLFAIILFAISTPIGIYAEMSDQELLAQACNKVGSLFYSLELVSDKSIDNFTLSKIRSEFEDYFMSDDLHCPNEFKNIWPQNSIAASYTTDIRPDSYLNMFSKMFRAMDYQNCKFSYRPLDSCIVREPEFNKNKEPAKLAQIVIQKMYKQKEKTLGTFNDTLIVRLEKMRISEWSNHASIHSIGNYDGLVDIKQLEIKAALAYDRKEYATAFKIYQTIVNRYPNDGNSYYRMAIMLHKRDVYKNLSRKKRGIYILDYLDKAIKNGSYPIKNYASNMKYWVTN